MLLSLIKYDDFKWKTEGDLNIIGFLTAIAKGLENKSIQYVSLVPPELIVQTPLRNKFGMFNIFANSLESEGQPIKLLKDNFPQ